MERASPVRPNSARPTSARPIAIRPPRRYGDADAERGAASWALWSMERGEALPGRYRSWAEAETARAGDPDRVPCLTYDWGGGD